MSHRLVLYMINGTMISTTVSAAVAHESREMIARAWNSSSITKGSVTILGSTTISANPAHIMAVTVFKE